MKQLIFLLCTLTMAHSLSARNIPPRALFDAEKREGDTRPKPNLTPNPFPQREGAGVRSRAKAPGWQPNGIIVCDTANCSLPKIVPDGYSGAIICWTENYRGADSLNHYTDDIYAQRVDSGGNFVWQSQGVPVCSLGGSWSNYPAMISDGKGGAIIAWEDGRDGLGYTRVFAQRLDGLGNRLWPENGVLVCNQMSGYVDLCTDGHGGAIIAYVDGRDEINTSDNIYAQRIDSAGNPVWVIDGVPVCTADSIQFWPMMCSDNNGGAIITWQDDYRNSNTTGRDVYAQKLDSIGNTKWALNGEPLCMKPGMQRARNPVVNMHGGGIIYWWAFSDTNLAYGQSLDSNGNYLWGLAGKETKLRGDLNSDERGGYIVSSPNTVQRIDSNGNILWGTGISIYPDSGGFIDACKDGEGGVITICDKLRNNPFNADQYAQRVDSNGILQWDATGIPICTLQVAGETYPQVTSDGIGGAICTWHGWYPGARIPMYREIIAQRVDANGTPGGVSGEDEASLPQQHDLALSSFPNPTTGRVTISFKVGNLMEVEISIYNIIGQKLMTFSNLELKHRRGLLEWNGKDDQGTNLSAGLYICRLKHREFSKQIKILKIK